MPEIQYIVELPAFTGRNVPIKEIAKAIGKDAQYVRVGIQQGVLKFGYAIKIGNPMSTITIARIKRSGKKPDISEMMLKLYRVDSEGK